MLHLGNAGIDHLGFWRDFKNHAELNRLIEKYKLRTVPDDFNVVVHSVAKRWMKLADVHLKDAKMSCSLECRRTFYSRAYYAVYSASKSVRYIAKGFVSDKGDDHQKVSDLPVDFPDYQKWGSFLRNMYKNRLVADYDGWTYSKRSLNADLALVFKESRAFVRTAKNYLRANHGIAL